MKARSFKKFLTAMIAVFALVLSMPLTSTKVAAENSAVTNDTKGVLQVKVVYVDDSNVSHDVQSGTAFLINDTTAITAEHVVDVDDETLADIVDLWANGKTTDQVKGRLQVVVNVLRDNTMTATVMTSSVELDFAVLNLKQAIKNRTYLPIESSSNVVQTANCYALGFPAEFERLAKIQTFTSEDVTIQSGQVSRLMDITTSTGTATYVVNNAHTTPGFSGGPLVDENGNIIGVLKGSTSGNGFDQDYFYAVATDEIIKVLDSWGIDYTKAGGSATVEPTVEEPVVEEPVVTADKTALSSAIAAVEALDTSKYTEDSASELNAALTLAKTTNEKADATQDDVDKAVAQLNKAKDALVEQGGFPLVLVIGIGAAVLVVLVVVIVIVAKNKKKKPEVMSYDAPIGGPVQQPVPPAPFNEAPAAPVNSPMPSYGGSNETTVLGGTAGETTVLGGSAGETTVLNAQTYGTLVRKKNAEKISINKPSFRIGRERNNVDYCVSDNTNVGRVHAEIVSSGTKTFVVDKNSRNFTFVNDVKCTPGQQVELRDGDRVMLADEEFTYHQF